MTDAIAKRTESRLEMILQQMEDSALAKTTRDAINELYRRGWRVEVNDVDVTSMGSSVVEGVVPEERVPQVLITRKQHL